MSRLRTRRLVAATAVVAATVAIGAAPAQASTPITPGATALSIPAYTGTGTLKATLSLTGAIGGLLDNLISPIVNQDLNPLIAALQGLTVNSLVSSALGTSSQYVAGTPSQQTTPAPAAFPNDTVPAPCGTGYGIPCYSATNVAPNLGSSSALSLSSLSGWTQQVASTADATIPMYARSSIASTSVSVLPAITSIVNPVVTAGSANAKANCPNDGSAPSAVESGSGVKMLGGLVTFDVSSGGNIANLVVNGVAYSSISTMPSVTVGSVTVSPFGANAIKTAITLSASSLINGLGLTADATSALLNYLSSSSITLNVTAGPSDNVTNSSASAWGLGISADLTGSIGFNLLGLVGATVSIPTGITNGNYGNVLDLRLGYASCQVGAVSSGATPAVPPALI